MTRPIRGSIFRTAVPVLALALLAGCSLRSIAVRSAAEILPRGIAAFYEEPDPALAREAMGSQLKLVEVLLKNDPGNPELLLAAAQGTTLKLCASGEDGSAALQALADLVEARFGERE